MTNSSTVPDAPSLPLTRVKKIIKEDKDVNKIANDAVICTAVAAEVFIEYLVRHAYQYTKRDNRKTVSYKDLGMII
jgi:DNA polymerase epsilon subunit 4